MVGEQRYGYSKIYNPFYGQVELSSCLHRCSCTDKLYISYSIALPPFVTHARFDARNSPLTLHSRALRSGSRFLSVGITSTTIFIGWQCK